MAKLDKKELLSVMKLGGNKADLYLARITQEKIEEVKSIIDNLKLQKGDDGKTPTDKELVELIKPLIPEPIKGDDAEPITDEQLLELIKPLIPEIPKVVHGDDGKDYVLTAKDLEDIANLVDVEIPEVAEMTVEQVISLMQDIEKDVKVLDISNIDGLEEKLKGISNKTIVGGGGNRLFENLLDVDTSNLEKVNGKYVFGGNESKGYASFYLTTGGVSSISNVEKILVLNNTSLNSDDTVFELSNNQVTVNKTGNFQINYDSYLNNSSTVRTEYSTYLKKNGVEVVGTRSANYQRGYDSGNSNSMTIMLPVTSGDYFEIAVILTDGISSAGYQDANGTRFNIKEL